MPPKQQGKKKGGGGKDDDDEAPSGTCNSIKVRHILCEKQGKCLEALREVRWAGAPESTRRHAVQEPL
jgi:peptidyl-prolyl cis-trans isomerase NIMA-interacting 4